MTLKSQPIKEDGRWGLSRTEHLLPPSARDRHQEGRTSQRPGENTADTHPTKHLFLQHFENFLISVTRKQVRDLSRLVTGETEGQHGHAQERCSGWPVPSDMQTNPARRHHFPPVRPSVESVSSDGPAWKTTGSSLGNQHPHPYPSAWVPRNKHTETKV